MDSPDPEPTLSLVQQKKTKRELNGEERQQIVSRLLFEMQHLGIEGKYLRDTNGQCGEFHVTQQTISRIWARAQEILRIQTFVSFVPAPGKRRSVDESRNGTNHDEIVKLFSHHTPFKRRTIRKLAHALIMLKSCFGIVCHDGRGIRMTMACEVDNDVNLPTSIANDLTAALCGRQLCCC